MPNEHEPLPEPSGLSSQRQEWLESELRPGRTRLTLFMNVVTTTPRPSNKDQTILDGYVSLCKLHDKEPALLVDHLENKAPSFFAGVPTRGGKAMSFTGKKAFVGDALRHYIGGGRRKYGKPNLRNQEDELEEID